MSFTVYLSGEIHTEWRNEIKEGAQKNGLDIEFVSAETDHDASDAAGDHLGGESNPFWHDHKSAKVNAIRTKTLIKKSDLVIVGSGNTLCHFTFGRHCTSIERSRCHCNGMGDYNRSGRGNFKICHKSINNGITSREKSD